MLHLWIIYRDGTNEVCMFLQHIWIQGANTTLTQIKSLMTCKSLQLELLFFTRVRANAIQRASNTCLMLGPHLFVPTVRPRAPRNYKSTTQRTPSKTDSVWPECAECVGWRQLQVFTTSCQTTVDSSPLICAAVCMTVHEHFHICVFILSLLSLTNVHRSHRSSHIFSTGRAVDHCGSPQQPLYQVLSSCGASVGWKKREESTCGQPPEVYDPRVQRSRQRSSRGQYTLSDVTSSLRDR